MEFDRMSGALEVSQNKRLLHLETALPSATLVVHSAHWVESVSGHGAETAHLFATYFDDPDESLWPTWHTPPTGAEAPPPLCPFLGVIDTVCGSAHLALKTLLGEQMSLRLMLEDGSHRTFHGYVVMASNLGSDNGRSLIRLGIASFTHFMFLRKHSEVFCQKTVLDVVNTVLSRYPQANFQVDVSGPGASTVCGVITQFEESDGAFLARLLARQGWNWHLEHEDGGPPLSEARAAKHRLVITSGRQPTADQGSLRFTRTDVRQDSGLVSDSLTELSLSSQTTPNAVTLGGWDPGTLAGVSAQAKATDVLSPLEVYHGGGERLYAQHDIGSAQDQPDSGMADHQAQRLLAQKRLPTTVLHGQGGVRRLGVYRRFEVQDHSRFQGDAARFCTLSIEHLAANNVRMEVAGVQHQPPVKESSYQQRFTALPLGVEVVPPQPHRAHAKPQGHPQLAVVVGWDAGSFGPVTTNRELQVRIQFPWQRGASPVSGGLSGTATPQGAPTGHATSAADASVWVRVAQPSAGADWGSSFLPRVGTEVLVDFVDGDIDRPVVVGMMHSPQDGQPWPGGEDSGANHAGVLSGLHTHSHAGAQDGINQWVLDDTQGQLRMRLASWGQASPWSELSLGHLISQGKEGGATHRGAWLGSGFYAHTDGWGVIRAKEGLLFSTSTRKAVYGSAESTQMDAKEAVQALELAQQLGKRLNDAAQGQGASLIHSVDKDPEQALEQLRQDIDPRERGKHPQHFKLKPGSRDEGSDPVERFDRPHIVMETPSAGILASPGPISHYSGLDESLVAQGDIHLASAHTIASVSGQTTSFYNHQGPIQLVTANADFSLAAHTDELEILADDMIVTQSVTGDIHIAGKTRVEIISGDSRIVLDGANIDFHCNEFIVQSSTHEFEGPASGTAEFPVLANLISQASGAPSMLMGAGTSASPSKATGPGFSAGQQDQITQALASQRVSLLERKIDLMTWDSAAQERFQKAFGTTDAKTKQLIERRVDATLSMNESMKLSDFKPPEKAVVEQIIKDKEDPADLQGYVYGGGKAKTVYLGEGFWTSSDEQRASTLSHEMSHFKNVGGTKDKFGDYKQGIPIYGYEESRQLAVDRPDLAAKHADSFARYITPAK